MSTINDNPGLSSPGFGETFSYNVWTPNTQIELCNVPWNSDYRDVVKFADSAALDTYLDNIVGARLRISKMTYARVGDPVRINIPFNICYRFNYIRVSNPAQPIAAKYYDEAGFSHTHYDNDRNYYYFIQDVKYLAPNTTEIVIMLDVWQTFGYDIEFGNCYIDRGHVGIANENQFANQGRDYLAIPEGLDVGAEYNVNRTHKYVLPSGTADDSFEGANHWVIVGIGADIEVDPGTVDAPNLKLANGRTVDGMPVGFDVLAFKNSSDFRSFISDYSDTPWVLQSVMFITLVPAVDTMSFPILVDVSYKTHTDTVSGKAFRISSYSVLMIERTLASSWRDDAKSFIPSRYSNLQKFLTYPYTVVEMTTYNGTPLIMRPELMPGDDIVAEIYQHMAPPSPRWGIVPKHYNATGTDGSYDDGEYLDFATYITNFPQFTVVNNGYLEYLAANRNSIHYGYSSAEWSQQKALHGASTSYQNELRSQGAAESNAAVQRALNSQLNTQRNDRNLSGIVTGGIAGLAQGNPIGALQNELNAGASSLFENTINDRSVAAQNAANQAAINNTLSAQSQNAGANYSYAQYAARGDYQNDIAAVQARVQDAKLIQPTTVGQLGGESFVASLLSPTNTDIGGGAIGAGWSIYTKIKQINAGMFAVIGEYWLRYGYAVNRFANLQSIGLQCMSKFTYWKLKETYIISSACPEVFKQSIRGIFEKGVTVWTNPDDIGTIDIATNTPLAGISL